MLVWTFWAFEKHNSKHYWQYQSRVDHQASILLIVLAIDSLLNCQNESELRWIGHQERHLRKLRTFYVALVHWTPRMLGPHTDVSHADTCRLARRVIALRNWLTWAESWQWCRCIHCALRDDWSVSVSHLTHWRKDAQGAVHSDFRYAYCLNMSFEFECTAEILSLELQTTFVSILSLAPEKYCSKRLLQGMLVLASSIEASFLCCQQMPRSLRHQSSVCGWDGNVFRNRCFVKWKFAKMTHSERRSTEESCTMLYYITTFAASLEFPPRCSDKGIWAWGRSASLFERAERGFGTGNRWQPRQHCEDGDHLSLLSAFSQWKKHQHPKAGLALCFWRTSHSTLQCFALVFGRTF